MGYHDNDNEKDNEPKVNPMPGLTAAMEVAGVESIPNVKNRPVTLGYVIEND